MTNIICATCKENLDERDFINDKSVVQCWKCGWKCDIATNLFQDLDVDKYVDKWFPHD